MLIIYSGYEKYSDTITHVRTNSFTKPLVGTTVLQSRKTLNSGWTGLRLTKVNVTECQKTSDVEILKKIGVNAIDVLVDENRLTVELQLVDNCCFNFLCEVSFKDGIIDLEYTPYGEYCGCNCCFGLTFYLEKDTYDDEEELKFTKVRINKSDDLVREIDF